VVGCTYRGMPENRSRVRNLLGGNASFRREAFDLAGGFQNGIGRSAGKRPLGCEETEFCIRVTQNSPESVFLFDNRVMISHLNAPLSVAHAGALAALSGQDVGLAGVGIAPGQVGPAAAGPARRGSGGQPRWN
jgi:hypothetical protein